VRQPIAGTEMLEHEFYASFIVRHSKRREFEFICCMPWKLSAGAFILDCVLENAVCASTICSDLLELLTEHLVGYQDRSRDLAVTHIQRDT